MKKAAYFLFAILPLIFLMGCELPIEPIGSAPTETPILLVFTAEWCGTCREQSPIVDQIAATRKVNVVKIDADSNESSLAQYQINSLPTYIYVAGNAQVWREQSAEMAYHRIVEGR